MNIKFARNGATIGEYPEEAVPALISSGVLRAGDFYWYDSMPEWTPIEVKWPSSKSIPFTPVTPRPSGRPTCQVCRQGELVMQKTYRMSTPVVLIGWLLLIPSFIGISIGICLIIGTGAASVGATASLGQKSKAELLAARVPNEIAEKAVAGSPLSPREKAQLTPSQLNLVSSI